MQRLIGFLVLLVALGGGFAFWYLHASAKPSVSFRTEAASRGDLTASVNATGVQSASARMADSANSFCIADGPTSLE